jgi:hypothetical protein
MIRRIASRREKVQTPSFLRDALADKGNAALFGKGEVRHHCIAGGLRISGINRFKNPSVMPAEHVVVIIGDINRPPDRLLEFLHGVKNILHQVQPNDVVGGAGNNDMEVGIQVLGWVQSLQIALHA